MLFLWELRWNVKPTLCGKTLTPRTFHLVILFLKHNKNWHFWWWLSECRSLFCCFTVPALLSVIPFMLLRMVISAVCTVCQVLFLLHAHVAMCIDISVKQHSFYLFPLSRLYFQVVLCVRFEVLTAVLLQKISGLPGSDIMSVGKFSTLWRITVPSSMIA